MAKIIAIIFMSIIFFLCMTGDEGQRAVLVHNSLQEIDACKGKLKLELVRVWGGDKEEDDNKFFKTPIDVVVSQKDASIYICDQHAHCIKVFKDSGEYLRTISQRGQGPGDTFAPSSLALFSNDDLLVYEKGGLRFQRFSPFGKSIQIIKSKDIIWWVDVNSKDEMVVYNPWHTLRTKKLLSILDSRGKSKKEIGTHHDTSTEFLGSEKLLFSMDDSDNIYAANTYTPVIRKYSPGGELLMAITFAPPYEIPPVEIILNSNGNEIEIIREDEEPEQFKIKANKENVIIQKSNKGGKPRVGVCWALGSDSKQRTYAVTRRRLLTDKEKRATILSWSVEFMRRDEVDYDIADKIDVNRLLVFNSNGKVIAEAQLTTFCHGMYISGDRVFIIDGNLNQRIIEYRMHLDF